VHADEPRPASRFGCLLDALAGSRGVTILAGQQSWIPGGLQPLGVVVVPFQMPGADQRAAHWRTHLGAHGFALASDELATLAGRFCLTPVQIADAVAAAANHARLRATNVEAGGQSAQPSRDDFYEAARQQSGHALAALARKIEPLYGWDDLILPDDTLAQLQEICRRVDHRHRVLDVWGFGGKLSLGKGVNVLFAGASGTGKTMAAQIFAGALRLDLYQIDLSHYLDLTPRTVRTV
jgi:hypothetical protein